MISRVVKTFSSYLSKPFQKVKEDFIRFLFGKYLSSLFHIQGVPRNSMFFHSNGVNALYMRERQWF